jgi:PAS domain S-box-containing protein
MTNSATSNNLSSLELLNVFKSLPGQYVILLPNSPKFTIVEVSEEFLIKTYKKRKHLTGVGIFEAFPPNPLDKKELENKKSLMRSFTKVIKNKKEHQIKVQKYDIINPKTGTFEEKYWRPLNKPILDKDGNVIFILHYSEDITKIVKLEEHVSLNRKKLENQQRKLISFFQHAPVAVAILSGPKFLIEYSNPFFCKIIGKQTNEIINRPLLDHIIQSKKKNCKEIFKEILTTGNSFTTQDVQIKTLTSNNQEECYFNFVFEPIKNQDGTVTGIFVLAIEVTEQFLLRKEVEKREKRLEFALNASNMGIWEINLKTDENYRSFRHDEIFGYQKPIKKWNYEVFLEHVHPDDLETVHNIYKKAIQSNNLEIVTRIITQRKEIRWIEILGQTSFDEHGEPEKLSGVIKDITERKLLEIQKEESMQAILISNEELEEVNKAKDKFITVISHDLRNPISSILQSSEIIMKELEETNDLEIMNFINIIHKSSQKVVNQLDDLIYTSRQKSTRTFFNPIVLNLHQTVNTSIQILETTAFNKKIKVINQTPENVYIKADLLLFRSIIQNLVSNAIKFTPEGGLINIDSKIKNAQFIEIKVQDNGIGIQEDVLKIILEGDKKYTTKGTSKEIGSGLGLKLSKEFAEKQGGKLWATSKPGEGSSFIFTIPKGM